MRKIIVIIIVFIIIFVSAWITSYVTGYIFVFPISKMPLKNKVNYIKGDIIQPLKDIDLDSGTYNVYLVINQDDRKNLNKSIPKGRCLKTSDISLIRQMQQEWKFIYTDGNMATVESQIYIFRNHKLIFNSGIVLDESKEGLQSEDFGWIEPVNIKGLSKICKHFKRVKWPIVVLR